MRFRSLSSTAAFFALSHTHVPRVRGVETVTICFYDLPLASTGDDADTAAVCVAWKIHILPLLVVWVLGDFFCYSSFVVKETLLSGYGSHFCNCRDLFDKSRSIITVYG